MAQDPFFKEKREWSLVKDGILRYYIKPYVQTVQSLNRRIIIVDTFAGPGQFEDGSEGSPLIIAKTCQEHVPGRHVAVFTNIEEDQHQELEVRLEPFPDAYARKMRARETLERLNERITDETVFIYLDPYGIEDCDYELVKPLLDRTSKYSTEMLLVFQMPYVHRQASRERVLQELASLNEKHPGQAITIEDAIDMLPSEQQSKIQNVDKLMGGTYWREIEYSDAPPNERAELMINAYLEKIAHPDKLAMSCPVSTDYDEAVKYYIVFASRHRRAAVYMNEAMLNSTDEFYKYKVEMRESLMPSLFGPELSPWHVKRDRDRAALRSLIPQYVGRNQPRIARGEVWFKIMSENFMRFSQSDFRKLVRDLIKAGHLEVQENSVNDNTVLYLPGDL